MKNELVVPKNKEEGKQNIRKSEVILTTERKSIWMKTAGKCI